MFRGYACRRGRSLLHMRILRRGTVTPAKQGHCDSDRNNENASGASVVPPAELA